MLGVVSGLTNGLFLKEISGGTWRACAIPPPLLSEHFACLNNTQALFLSIFCTANFGGAVLSSERFHILFCVV